MQGSVFVQGLGALEPQCVCTELCLHKGWVCMRPGGVWAGHCAGCAGKWVCMRAGHTCHRRALGQGCVCSHKGYLRVPRTHLGQTPGTRVGAAVLIEGCPLHGDVCRGGEQCCLFAQAGAHLLMGCVLSPESCRSPRHECAISQGCVNVCVCMLATARVLCMRGMLVGWGAWVRGLWWVLGHQGTLAAGWWDDSDKGALVVG